MTHHSIWWNDEEAHIRTYTATTKANGNAVVKIELEIADPMFLGFLLRELAAMKKAQSRPRPAAAATPETAASKPPQALLTYRGKT